ncbi:UNVERIFIED_CONTAM: hypothetical protein Sindi_1805100 [Sesamum indicum]
MVAQLPLFSDGFLSLYGFHISAWLSQLFSSSMNVWRSLFSYQGIKWKGDRNENIILLHILGLNLTTNAIAKSLISLNELFKFLSRQNGMARGTLSPSGMKHSCWELITVTLFDCKAHLGHKFVALDYMDFKIKCSFVACLAKHAKVTWTCGVPICPLAVAAVAPIYLNVQLSRIGARMVENILPNLGDKGRNDLSIYLLQPRNKNVV